MAKVNMNHPSFEEIEENIYKADEALQKAEECWGENFDNLYNNIVTSGFLDSLYEDAESNYYKWKNGLSFTSCTLGGAALGLTFGPIGGIIGAIVGAIFGIFTTIKNDPTWITVSKEVFEQLLADCQLGNDDNYVKIVNLMTKMYNVKVSLENIKTHINDYQHEYANLQDAADQVGLGDKVQYASDGLTVTNVNTTIQIEGQEVETTVAEAMNAFYTYTATVTAAEIEAEYMHQKYPDLDIDFSAIIHNANAFMTNTINSDLYSKEFIDHILPGYTATLDEAKDGVITGAHGLGLDGLETLLGVDQGLLGDLGLYAGLIGTTFLPIDPWPEDMQGGDPDTGSQDTGTEQDTGSQDTGSQQDTTPQTSQTPTGCSSPGCSSPGCGGCGGATPTTPVETTPETVPETVPETTPGNEVEIEPIDESEIPEDALPFDYGMGDEVDYDKLAREAYEFGDTAEEIAKHQQELLDQIEQAYADGNLDGLRDKLKEYGFSGPEIDAILADKYQCIKTMMYCDKREQLAKLAQDLAKADGIENYDTKFDEAIDYDKELAGTEPNDLLMLASEDETCVKAYDTMSEAKDAYQKALDEANPIIKEANDKKKAMEEIKAKYEKEFSSEDTKKWTEEAAKEYNEAIKSYNESAKSAAAQIATVEAAKVTYQEARTAFETAENNYYEQIRENQNLPLTDDGNNGGSQDPTQQQDGGGNNDGNGDGNGNGNGNNQATELHTDNVVFDENGDIIFDMNETGEVQGATLDTSDATLDTSDIDRLIS